MRTKNTFLSICFLLFTASASAASDCPGLKLTLSNFEGGVLATLVNTAPYASYTVSRRLGHLPNKEFEFSLFKNGRALPGGGTRINPGYFDESDAAIIRSRRGVSTFTRPEWIRKIFNIKSGIFEIQAKYDGTRVSGIDGCKVLSEAIEISL